MPLPALLIGPEARITAANARAQALLGREIRGRHFITVLRQPDLIETIETCLHDSAPRETRYLSNDGACDTRFRVSCAQVATAQGKAVLVGFEDMTQVEEAGQMRRDFVANVSHELRTPLTSLLGFIETLQGPARDDPAATARFLGIMQSEAARMERLVRDLLSLSRVEAEERVRPSTPVDFGATIRAVAEALRPLAAQSDVGISLQIDARDVLVPADADQLAQVVSNLIENAIKYGGAGKTVHVSLYESREEPLMQGAVAVLCVRDEGPGIALAHVPRLTERFYRIDNHRSREMGGTGLGLAIVKHIVNRHRGRLRITSDLGKGSEFKVMLPCEPLEKPRHRG